MKNVIATTPRVAPQEMHSLNKIRIEILIKLLYLPCSLFFFRETQILPFDIVRSNGYLEGWPSSFYHSHIHSFLLFLTKSTGAGPDTKSVASVVKLIIGVFEEFFAFH